MQTKRPILVLGGEEGCEILNFKKWGMQERNDFYLINRSEDAKPDLIGDFTADLGLAKGQFEAAMMSGVPLSEEKNYLCFKNAFDLLQDQGIFLYYVGLGSIAQISQTLKRAGFA